MILIVNMNNKDAKSLAYNYRLRSVTKEGLNPAQNMGSYTILMQFPY